MRQGSLRRSRRIPEPRDGFISTRDERQAKHHCQRQTRLGRSLRIPKHRDGCSTVNRVRSSRPSLTTRVRLGRFRRIPERRDGCNVQTVQTTDLPNSSRVPFNQLSQAKTTSQRVESKAAGVTFQLRSGGTSGYGRDTTTLYAQSASSGRKEESSTQRSLRAQHPVEQNTVFTQSSPEDREVDKEQGHQPKDWNCNKVRPQSHSSSGSRTAGQVSPLDVGYLRGSWRTLEDREGCPSSDSPDD